MKNILRFLTVVAVIAISLAGCKKNNTTVPPNGVSSVDSSGQVFSQNAMPFQTYCNFNDTENYSVPVTITGSKGTVFGIPNYAFQTLTGVQYPGNVCIKYKEFYKTSDFILNNISTLRMKDSANGHQAEIMRSEGIFNITAEVNGLPFYLVPGYPITLIIPINDTYNNQMYNADWDSLNTLGVMYPNTPWWVSNDVTTIMQGYNLSNQFVDIIACDSMGWTNLADSNWWNGDAGGPTFTYTLYSPSSSSFADMQIFLVLGKRTVAKAYLVAGSTNTYEIPGVPDHASGTLVAWCVSTGKQLLYQITPLSNLMPAISTYTINMTQTTSIDSLTTFIKNLDAQY